MGRAHAGWLLPIAAAFAALALLHLFAPLYLFHQGFPLDDSWIHAVYARELARSGTLAYNPGVAATGETAPLWPLLVAPAHWTGSSATAVAATKVFGFLLHALSCAVLGVALARVMPDRPIVAGASAALVAVHPHLVAASVSGMEVPLAALVIAGVFAATVSGRPFALFALGAAAVGARPEVAVIAVLVPLLFRLGPQPRRALALSAASFSGAVSALALLAVRNWMVSGLPLPATFYVKANRQGPFNPLLQQVGFVDLLGRIPLLDSVLVIVVLVGIALVLLRDRGDDAPGRAAASLYLAGAAFCAVSFALVPPVDPPAFYHQRYVLPGVVAMVAGMPLLIDTVVRRVAPRATQLLTPLVLAALAAAPIAATPARARHLSNDARNIDDVQVALGRALASAPPTAVAWVVDAGASRFFGNAFVVDTIGLNTPELLGAGAQAYLDAHPPAFLDVFPGWSRIEGDPHVTMPVRRFAATTPYTVTSAETMSVHLLVTCEPSGLRGRFVVRGRSWGFRCS